MYILPNVSFTHGVASSFVPFQDELNTIKAVSGYGRDVVMLDSDPFILPTSGATAAVVVDVIKIVANIEHIAQYFVNSRSRPLLALPGSDTLVV